MRSLDSVPLNLVYYLPCQKMVLVPPFPPLQYSPGFLSQCSFPASYLFSPYCLLSIRLCSVGRPPPASGHPSSVRRKSTHLQLTAIQCPSPGFMSSVPYEPPPPLPPTCAVGGTWIGCGWRGVGDGAPRDGLEFLAVLTGVARRSVPLVNALGPS